MKSKKFQQNKAQAAALLEWARTSKPTNIQSLIATECNIQDEQEALQAAWDELQSVPSYCEQQAAAFVKEDTHE